MTANIVCTQCSTTDGDYGCWCGQNYMTDKKQTYMLSVYIFEY